MAETGTLHAECKQLNGSAAAGKLQITVNTTNGQVRDPGGNVVFAGPLSVALVAGEATLTLPSSDDTSLEPSGFTYTVVEQLDHVEKSAYRSASFQVPAGETVELADQASDAEVAEDPSYGANLNGLTVRVGNLEETVDGLPATYVYKGDVAPDETVQGWLDTSTEPPVLKGWDGATWVPIGGGGAAVTIDADGSLVVDGVTVEMGTDAEVAAAIAAAASASASDATTKANAAAAASVAKSLVDAKGDIFAGTANDTVARVAVGANDSALLADSTQAAGVKWGAIPASKFRDDISAYNFSSSSLRNWRNAYAKQQNAEGQAHICFYGDSVTNGYQGASPYFQNSWPARTKVRIDAKTGVDVGTGFVSSGQLTQGGGENRFSFTGSWSALGFGPAAQSLGAQGNASPPTMTIGPITTDRIRVHYAILGNGGAVTATLDGSPATGFNCGGSNNRGFVDYTATQGSHTVVLTGPTSSSQYIYIIGWEAFKNGTSTGIRQSNLGYNGRQANDLTNFTSPWHPGSAAIDMLAPNLAWISYGANDVANNNPSQFSGFLQTAITRLRSLGSDVVLQTLAPIPNGSTSTAIQQSYVDVMYALADTNDVCVLDIYKRFGPRGTTVSDTLMSDAQHPNSRGYWEISNCVAAALLATTVV